MNILSREHLTEGGFAGLSEHQLVTDSRVFGQHKHSKTSEGLGSFVYLADARFSLHGETGLHPHKEIDVISVMVDGNISHEGSLEHGQGLQAGDAQVQRAGGEGFSHNELNPDAQTNRMIQLWVLPETAGEPAGYKMYQPNEKSVTRIYGGSKNQTETFDSHTTIDIIKLQAGESFALADEQLSYVTQGCAEMIESEQTQSVKDGDLIRSHNATINAISDVQIIAVSQIK